MKTSPLVEIKLRLGVTQKRLAEAMGVDLDRVKSLMSGKAQHLRPQEIAGLVKEFHLNPDYFLDASQPMLEGGETFDEFSVRQTRMAEATTLVDFLPLDGISRARLKALMQGDPATDLKALSEAIASARPDAPFAAEGAAPYGPSTWSDFVQVPRYDIRASAGPGALVDGEHVLDKMAFRRDWLRGVLGLQVDRLALLDVDGDSMLPTLTHGDMILVDTRPADGLAPGIHVVNLDGRLLVKRLRPLMDGSVEVASDNERYGTETVKGDSLNQLRLVGRVVWQGRRI